MGILIDESGQKLRSGWILVLFIALAGTTYSVGSFAVGLLGLYPRSPLSLDDWFLVFPTLVMLAAAGIPTAVCVFALKVDVGLPRTRALADTLIGLAVGAGLVVFAVVVPVVAGKATLTLFGGGLAVAGIRQLVILGPTSVGEELLLRGVVMRQLAIVTRPWIAVALTGCAFGLMHLVNPGASWIAALNVALVGLWFGVLAIRTSLWTSIGAHLAWNWFEGFVLGQPVSGIAPGTSLFAGSVQPRGFFSGGDFGPEASGLTTVLLAIATLVCALWPKKPLPSPAEGA